MPTLMASQKTQPVALPLPPRSASPATIPATITLSFEGVDFKLCPSEKSSEMSYKNNSDSVVLSLSSFTGTLAVSKSSILSLLSSSIKQQQGALDSTTSAKNTSTIIATTASSTAPTVEDDPDSPEQHVKNSSRQTVSPGQQTLPFKSGNNKTSKKVLPSSKKDGSDTTESNRKRRKAPAIVIVKEPQATTNNSKRSRHDAKHSLPPISLGQASQTTQLTQIDTDTDEFNNDSTTLAPRSEPEIKTTNPLIGTPSVQEILDRDCIQSSGESIVTVKDSDDCVLGMKLDDGDMAPTDKQDEGINDDMIIDSSANDSEIAEDVGTGTFSYPAPPARWGHTMTQVDDGQILVYGGQSFDLDGNPVILSDVHVYDPKNGGSWNKPINCRGEARQWHSATFIPGRQQIIAFGGETIDPIGSKKAKKDKVITSDTLRVLDTEIMLWYPPAASGDVPTGRSGHTATFFHSTNELILFGGVRGSKWLNTVSVLDVTRWIWTTPHVVGTAPKPRSYHSATAVGPQKMVVFGGNNKTSCFNSVHVFEAIDGDNNSDSPCDGDGNNSKTGGRNNASTGWKWSNPTIRGKAPFPRTGHTATLLEDGKTIIIYGGWDPNEEDEITGEDNIFKGSYLLDTQEWTWKKGPDPQSGGSGSAKHVVESCGAKRCGHTAALNSENGEVFVFGGRIPGEALAGDVQRIVPPQEKTVELEGC